MLLVFGAISKQDMVTLSSGIKEHVTHCSCVAQWCVFNSFWTTTKVDDTENISLDIHTILVSRMSSLFVWLCTWDLLTIRKIASHINSKYRIISLWLRSYNSGESNGVWLEESFSVKGTSCCAVRALRQSWKARLSPEKLRLWDLKYS